MIDKSKYESFREQYNNWVKQLSENVNIEAEKMGILDKGYSKFGILPIPSYDMLSKLDSAYNDPNLTQFYDFVKMDWVNKDSPNFIAPSMPYVDISYELALEQQLTFDLRSEERMYGILLYFEELGDEELLQWGLKASYSQLEALVAKDIIPSYIPYKRSFRPERDDIDVKAEAERIKEAINL